MEPKRIVETAKRDHSLPNAQRLGYLLDLAGAGETCSELAAWIAESRPRYLTLRPDRPAYNSPKNDRWRLLVNEKIEVEL